LRIDPRARFILAGDCVDTALDLCRKLLAKGLGYEKLRSVYFDVLRDDHYGELARVDVEKLSVGKTVDMEAYVKEHDRDFTLLKRASLQDLKLGDVLETEWGNVRPSWFLQMAAAGLDGLGAVDVLLAGETHQFPHLENLRAIWAAAGVAPLVWMISKSVGRPSREPFGLKRAADLAGGPCALRLWLLSASYRKPLAATEENLAMWSRNWRKLQELVAGLRSETNWPASEDSSVAGAEAEALENSLAKALEDDLSLHRFWPELFQFIKTVNSLAAEGRLGAEGAKLCLDSLARVDAILGVVDESQLPASPESLPAEVAEIVRKRELARKSKDFALADALRDELVEAGYRLEDTASGPRVFSL
jgi:cysteinyl-tRNA synthetase